MEMRLIFTGVIFKQLLLAVTALWVVECDREQTTQGGVGVIARKQTMMVSSQELDQAAQQQYAQLVAEEQKKGTLNRNPAQVNRVRAITNRLIAQTSAFRPDAKK